MNLKEKKINIEALLKQKLQQFQNLENQRGQISSEILKLQGQLELIDEQIAEESLGVKESPKVEESPK